MSYKEKPILKLYKYENDSFVMQAQIDDYQEISFERNLYQAGTFTVTINYNIPNSQLFQRGLFLQFGNDPYDFGEIITINDSIGADGKGSQIRTIIGYDVRYILKRRVIKNMNSNGLWQMTAKGELCLRNLIKDQCGSNAETKRRLPIINIIPSNTNAIGKEYSVSEQFTNLYEVCKTIATQSEIGWRLAFNGTSLTLECYEGTDRSQTVQFSTSFDSLANGNFSDSSESFSNAIYVGGKGQNDDRDIYEGENGTPSGFDRFESWDNQSQMTTEDEYEAEAFAMLSQYGQTIEMSGNGLAKCPYIYKEQYNVGDWITVSFSGKSAVIQILSVTEHWVWANYDINFSFGKPKNNLDEQLQLILRKIQSVSDKTKATESVRWYNITTVNSMPKDDVTFDTIGFTGTMNSDKTFTFYLDNEKTGSKNYNVYFKNLIGNYKLTLTTGKSGATNVQFNGGSNAVARILIDEEGNIIIQKMETTSIVESGNDLPVTSGGVYDALQPFSKKAIGSAYTTNTYPNYYIRLYDIPTNNTSSTPVITLLVGTRYNRYLVMINPWYTSGDRFQIVSLTGNDARNVRIVDCAWFMSSTSQAGTMECWIKLRCNVTASGFSVLDLSRVIDTLKIDYIGNDGASYEGTTASAYFDNIANKGTLRLLDTTPTLNSDNLITSGGVYAQAQNIISQFTNYSPVVKNTFYGASQYNSNYVRALVAKGIQTSSNRDVSICGKAFVTFATTGSVRELFAFYFNIYARFNANAGTFISMGKAISALDGNSIDVSTLFTATVKMLQTNQIQLTLYANIKTNYYRLSVELERMTSGDVYPEIDLLTNSSQYSLPMEYVSSIPSDETIITSTRSLSETKGSDEEKPIEEEPKEEER